MVVDPSDTVVPPAGLRDPFVLIASGALTLDAESAVVESGSSIVTFDFAGGAEPGQQVELSFEPSAASAYPRHPRPRETLVAGVTQNGQPPGACRIEVIECPHEDGRGRPRGHGHPRGPGRAARWLR